MKYRGRLYEQAQIDDYSFVYSFDKNAQKDDDQADEAIKLLAQAGQTYGIKIKTTNPGFICVKRTRNPNKWIE